jgi:hypothetical protein
MNRLVNWCRNEESAFWAVMTSVAVPWFNGPEHAWGFDTNLQQLCSGQQPTPHAIPEGMSGFWAKAALGKKD